MEGASRRPWGKSRGKGRRGRGRGSGKGRLQNEPSCNSHSRSCFACFSTIEVCSVQDLEETGRLTLKILNNFLAADALTNWLHTHGNGSVYFELVATFLEELNCKGFECISQLSLAQQIAPTMQFLKLFCDWQPWVLQLKIHSLRTAASSMSSCTKFMLTIWSCFRFNSSPVERELFLGLLFWIFCTTL